MAGQRLSCWEPQAGPVTSTAAAPSPVRGYEMSRSLDLRKRAAVLLVNPNCPHGLQALACCFH